MPIQAIVQTSLEAVEFIDTPIPIPKPDQVVIKVVAAASNPKDWKLTVWQNKPHNSGDDVAGIVHSVGSSVRNFHPGDRVFAYHQPHAADGAYAEYAVAPVQTTCHFPPTMSFEEASTIPTAAFTAAVGLFLGLDIRAPFLPAPSPSSSSSSSKKRPLLIYGVTTAVGSFAAKLARLAGIHPIIGIAGRATNYARTLVDHVIDYRQSDADVLAAISAVLQREGLGEKVPLVFDAISEHGSLERTAQFIDPHGGRVATVLPPAMFARDKEAFGYPEGVEARFIRAARVFGEDREFALVWSAYMGLLLESGRLKGHPYEVVPGGLKGVIAGLQNLRDGKASGVKYVYRIEETE
ncbi:hypothetical protein COCMIDRAFT_41841 [Bipolaris oryzae ATCC 44560]|uniref:Enoyl reductase (ER) domain-containing protein n=1 Tax=Bipolaris oryzae ATCC 44560 TaxID=930090 RepID=W6YVX0_COCMI|nr:uncharacterized protein COCMIDRAFT_41841 [Bipolaris oryzae ATCC 44560]EUC39669.1 hypothetical protein COCMIDRAFT_41841 [Bipolaris oryzae ATCC 44560]